MKTIAIGLPAVLAPFAPLAIGGCVSPADPGGPRHFEERRVVMGVQARVVLVTESLERAREGFADAFERIERIEDALSDWRPAAEIARLNAAAGGPPQPVSEDLLRALRSSLELARASGGAFDPTVGPLVDVWKRARDERRMPSPEAIEAARKMCGIDRVEIDDGRRTVRLAEPGMRLDFGAIGAGIACDEALAVLRTRGFARALVEIGGDLAAGDAPPGEAGWSVAAGARTLSIANQGVASSGDAEQRLEAGGERWSHVIDPRTGLGVTGGIATCVIARDGATADALATAAGVLGPREGRALVERMGGRMLVDDPRSTVLFDGETLAGWTPKGGRYDGDARWTVEDECIVGRVNERGEGGLLYTEGTYTDCEFECEVKIDAPFDSGVFVRMVPQDTAPSGGGLKGAQVTLDDRPDGEIAAVYADGFLMHNESARGHWKVNAWNHVEVRITGADMRIEVWLNGTKVTDFQMTPSDGVYAKSGRIGIQVHGGMGEPAEAAARFREIRIRELAP